MYDPIYIAIVTDGLSQPSAEVFGDPVNAVEWTFTMVYGKPCTAKRALSGALQSLSAHAEWGVANGKGACGYVYCKRTRRNIADIPPEEAAGVAEDRIVYLTATRTPEETEALLSALRNDRRTAHVPWREQSDMFSEGASIGCEPAYAGRALEAGRRIAAELRAGAPVQPGMF